MEVKGEEEVEGQDQLDRWSMPVNQGGNNSKNKRHSPGYLGLTVMPAAR